jgi:CRP/FNR family transcriptional regulator, dissimilatory nitrate respiration regulator
MIAIMPAQIAAFLNQLRARRYRFDSGRFVFHRGDAVKEMHLVLAGSVHLVRHQSQGAALILQRAEPGSMLAEASLYSETYHCDAVAFGATETRAFAKAGVRKLLGTNPDLGVLWANYLAEELQRARLRSEMLCLRTVADRLEAWIAWHGGALPAKGEWKLIAGEIGVSPEALYREIARRRGHLIRARER